MLQNYFKIALRSLRRNGAYSIINIAGLSVGIAASILILLWVHDELTFNHYFSRYETLHQVKLNTHVDNGVMTGGFTPLPLREALTQDARIKHVAVTVGQSALLTVGDKKLNKRGLDASESFLEMFDFRLLQGRAETALADPRSIVLTKATAIALFGDEDPIGKMVQVKIEGNDELKVTAVVADPPPNISFSFDFILPFTYFEATSSWIKYARTNWSNNGFETYVELQPSADKGAVDDAIRSLVKTNSSEARNAELFLHPMSHWRLYNNFENGKEQGGLIDYVMLFSGIAVFILVIACINFMNLATARSEHRAREVGIRKSVGSSRKQLIAQFMGESLLISALAFVLSVALVEMARPFYNTLLGKHLTIDYTSPLIWIFGVSLVLITGVMAGSYPAFYLSSFQPAKILKGKVQVGKGGRLPRKVMVTLQFAFSILLFIGTVVIYRQIEFLKNREVGYDRENLMLVWSTSDLEKNYAALKQELVNSGAALSMAKSNSPITSIFASSAVEGWTGMRSGQHVEVTNIATEYDYTKTMGIKMLEGRDFSEAFASDTAAVILNHAAVRALDLKDPVGDKLKMWGQTWTIVGVMDDVLMGSGSRNIDPLVMNMDPSWSTTLTVRLPKTNDLQGSLRRVEAVFRKYNPDYPFEYRFADDEFQLKFSNITMISRLAGVFAVLALFITGLGLFGMAAFTAEQRTKEIGIRKVMGANVTGLVLLLTKDFSYLVLIAFVIAAPIAGGLANAFLERYQVRIGVPWWVFPLAGCVSLVITMIIVSGQAMRVSLRNPVDSLRSE
ncbi:ABC transporter permease [Chryseolinea lacunae]|uniref:ABC transporter permease n=1 Tax=Chryseolinea lacunae TaxID=2801331 RepID=A0ABS1KZ42_9BACT|nr:ABC transporter permease [Chryseolinea lacunae]MBL0744736.1 ABC transporter permease [Chryseolinea lacunae]